MWLAELSPGVDGAFQLPLSRDGAVNMGAFTLPRLQPGRAADSAKPYQKGDPVRFIDWRSYARTNKLYLREKVETTRVGVEIAIDGGPSMAFPDESFPRKGLGAKASKLELAVRLGYFLGYELASLGEQVALSFHHSEPQDVAGLVPQSSDRKLIKSHFEQIVGAETANRNPWATAPHIAGTALLPSYRPSMSARRFRIVISDALTTDVEGWLANFTGGRGVFIHALSHLELDLSWMTSDDVYFDQSAQSLRSTGKSFEKYHQQVSTQRSAWLEGCEAACQRMGWTYLQAVDTDPVDHFLACFAAGLKR